jgi:hypothetical protein
MNSLVAWISVCVRGYVLQLIIPGASGTNLMAWSSGCAGGNHFAPSSLNTLLCCLYLSGIPWSMTVTALSFPFWARSMMAQSWAKCVLQMMSSSPASHLGSIWAIFIAACSCRQFHHARDVTSSSICRPFMAPTFQSISGLNSSNQGYPSRIWSSPRFVM